MKLSQDNFNANILARKPSSILDVGCGSGRYYEWAKKYGIDYEGVDVDNTLIKKAKSKYAASVFHTFDGKSLSRFPSDSFDAILLIEVMEHVEDLATLKRLLKECVRVARDYIFFTTPNCSDEEFLIQHRLIYHHYTHTVGKGFNFKYDDAHKHHLRFTKKSLESILSGLASSFIVEERVPLDIRSTREPNRILYFKLWGIIDANKTKAKKKHKNLKAIKLLTKKLSR